MSVPRRPGRPPLDAKDRSVPVCIKMPARQYDQLYERAQRERVSVPDFIRRKLAADPFSNPK
jgi:hypothetical protein